MDGQLVQFGAERFGEQVASVEELVLPFSVFLPGAYVSFGFVVLESGRGEIDAGE